MANEQEGKKSKSKRSVRYWLKDMEAKNNLKNTAIKSASQIAVGVIGGALGTAILGKWSFVPGLGLIGLGNYKDFSWMAPMGIGMAASSLTLVAEDALQGVDGFDFKTEANNAKKRLVTLKDTFLKRIYVDKYFKKAADKKNGSGKSQRRVGEENSEEMNGLESPGSELDEVEKQLIASAMEFQKKQQSKQGAENRDLTGLEAEVDFSTM